MKKKYTNREAAIKLMKYCSYQERCHQEVNKKLYDWGFYKDDRNEIIVRLIEGNFINEERFAKAFTRGKFNIKKWGKQKITYALKQKQISDNLIKIALKEIDNENYKKTLKNVLIKKSKLIKEKNNFIKNKKLAQFVINKGYESDVVWEEIRKFE